MLTPQPPPDHLDPDAPMVGKCQAYGTVVKCARSACQHRSEPGFGSYLCVGCPRVLESTHADLTQLDGLPKCGTRVMMTAAT